jgi:hypothetical protein
VGALFSSSACISNLSSLDSFLGIRFVHWLYLPIIRSVGVDPGILALGDGILYQQRQWSWTGSLLCRTALLHLGFLDHEGPREMGYVEDMEDRRLALRC